MYNVGFTFTKLWFDKIELECAFYNNKKGIQALDFDSRFSHTHGTNIMPTLTLEKKDFLFKNRHKAQRKAKFYINKCRSASCMQGGLKQASA